LFDSIITAPEKGVKEKKQGGRRGNSQHWWRHRGERFPIGNWDGHQSRRVTRAGALGKRVNGENVVECWDWGMNRQKTWGAPPGGNKLPHAKKTGGVRRKEGGRKGDEKTKKTGPCVMGTPHREFKNQKGRNGT